MPVTIAMPNGLQATATGGEWTSDNGVIASTLNLFDVPLSGADPFPVMTIAVYVLSITPGATIVSSTPPDFDPDVVY